MNSLPGSIRAALGAAATFSLACAGDGTGPGGGGMMGALSFADSVQPIFNASCVTGCHVTGGIAPFILTAGQSHGNLVNVASIQVPAMDRIEPSDTSTSYLFHKIKNTHASVGGTGGQMPLGGGQLPADEIDVIRRWIVGGADNN